MTPLTTVGVNEREVTVNIRNNLITPVQITRPGKRSVTKNPWQRKAGLDFSVFSLCCKT